MRLENFAVIDSSSSIDDGATLAYVFMPYTERQVFRDVSDAEKIQLAGYNRTIPSCADSGFSIDCSKCILATYTNESVTFTCNDMSTLFPSALQLAGQEERKRSRSLSEASTSTTHSCIEMGSVFELEIILFAQIQSINEFRTDLAGARPIILLVAIGAGIVIFGALFFFYWDRNDEEEEDNKEKETMKKLLSIVEVEVEEEKGGLSLVKYSKLDKRISRILSFNNGSSLAAGSLLPSMKSVYQQENTEKDVFENYLKEAIPITKFKSRSFSQLLTSVFQHHLYFRMFGDASRYNTRLIRWIRLSLQVYLILFLNTIFFELFFPDNGRCESYKTVGSCLGAQVIIIGGNLCEWSSSVSISLQEDSVLTKISCTLTSPSLDPRFVMIIAAITILISAPLGVLIEFVQMEVCSGIPDKSRLPKQVADNLASFENDDTDSIVEDVAEKKLEEFHHKKNMKELAEPSSLQFFTRMLYTDTDTVHNEANALVKEIVTLFDHSEGILPSIQSSISTLMTPLRSTLHYLHRSFGIDASGSISKFSFRKWIFYGTPRNRIEMKLQRIRDNVKHVRELMEVRKKSIMRENHNVVLLRFFMLEQLPAYERYAMKYQNFMHSYITPKYINPVLWMCGWLLMVGLLVFFIIWVLRWCLSSRGYTFTAWLLTSGLIILEEIFLIQILQVYLMNVATLKTIIPRLETIMEVLRVLSMDILFQANISESLNEFRVVQYLSPSCRVARKKAYCALPASKVLRYVNDLHVYKCRHPKNSKQLDLFSSLILSLPSLLVRCFGIVIGEIMFRQLVPSIICIMILLAVYLLIYSYMYFAVIVVGVIVIMMLEKLWRSAGKRYSMKLSHRFATKSSQINVNGTYEGRSWRVANGARREKWTILSPFRFIFQVALRLYKAVHARRMKESLYKEKHNHQWKALNIPSVFVSMDILDQWEQSMSPMKSPGKMMHVRKSFYVSSVLKEIEENSREDKDEYEDNMKGITTSGNERGFDKSIVEEEEILALLCSPTKTPQPKHTTSSKSLDSSFTSMEFSPIIASKSVEATPLKSLYKESYICKVVGSALKSPVPVIAGCQKSAMPKWNDSKSGAKFVFYNRKSRDIHDSVVRGILAGLRERKILKERLEYQDFEELEIYLTVMVSKKNMNDINLSYSFDEESDDSLVNNEDQLYDEACDFLSNILIQHEDCEEFLVRILELFAPILMDTLSLDPLYKQEYLSKSHKSQNSARFHEIDVVIDMHTHRWLSLNHLLTKDEMESLWHEFHCWLLEQEVWPAKISLSAFLVWAMPLLRTIEHHCQMKFTRFITQKLSYLKKAEGDGDGRQVNKVEKRTLIESIHRK
jgi:hypothetical protein